MVKTDKDFYDRKIVYLDYLERGVKVKNGGFVKWEARGETSRIQIQIRGLYPTDTLRGEIQLISRQDVHTADSVKIDFGSGEYVGVWKNEDLAGTAVSYEECDGVQVKLSESRLLIGRWRKREALQEKQQEDKPAAVWESQPEDIRTVPESRTEAAAACDEGEESAIAEARSEETVEMQETEEESIVGVEGERQRVEEASAEEKGGEPERNSAPEAPEGTKESAVQQKSVLEEVTEAKKREETPEKTPEAATEAEEGEAKPESTREIFAGAEESIPAWKGVPKISAEMEAEEKDIKPENIPKAPVDVESEESGRESGQEKYVRVKRVEKASDERKSGNKNAGRNLQSRELLSGDKWEQLNKQYPHIHPFGDAREYLSITPRDFVILSRKYQELVQNSFLLHGYYNYGHVILTRIKEKSGERFYLGVPGVYYMREKQAALMFGFEGFEAGTEQAVDGGFGYYMKQVDI